MKGGNKRIYGIIAAVATLVLCVVIILGFRYFYFGNAAYEGKWEKEISYIYDKSSKKYEPADSYRKSSFVIDKKGAFKYTGALGDKETGKLKKYKKGLRYEGEYEGGPFRWTFTKEKDKLVVVTEDLKYDENKEKTIYVKKENLSKRIELSEGRAVKIVSDQGKTEGASYDVSKIKISPIQAFGKGYIFSAVYTGDVSFCDLYYVQKNKAKWNVIKRQKNEIELKEDISFSTILIEGKKIVWGNVNPDFWCTDSAYIDKDTYVNTLLFQMEDGQEIKVSLKEQIAQEAYVQVMDNLSISAYKLLNDKDEVVKTQEKGDGMIIKEY